MKSNKIAFLGLFVALSLIFSYIESHIPTLVAIPGIKLGIPNIAIIIMLYKVGAKEAIIVSILRVLLVSLLFGNTVSLIYSIAGAALSLTIMILMKKSNLFSTITVSVVGAICHNIGQILVAFIITETAQLFYYLPALLISGCIAGIVIGLISAQVVKKLKNLEF